MERKIKKHRILAGIASVLLGLFGIGGYFAWAIADFYHISDQLHFGLVLACGITLLLISAYWMFFAFVGHRLVAPKVNQFVFWCSIFTGVSGSIFVATFFI